MQAVELGPDGWGVRDDAGRRIAPVRALDLPMESGGWPELEPHRAAIDAHFAARSANNPHIWNGRVLVSRTPRFVDGRLSAACREVDFASFMWWRDTGWRDYGAVNIFGLAALEGADGGFVLGVMGDHTASAGRIYFPCGTPDLDDVTEAGQVDLLASAYREMAEETGLRAGDVAQDLGWTGIFDGPRIALMRRLVFAEPAAALAERIRGFLRAEKKPELSDVTVVHREADLADPRMVPFGIAYIRTLWRAREAAPVA